MFLGRQELCIWFRLSQGYVHVTQDGYVSWAFALFHLLATSDAVDHFLLKVIRELYFSLSWSPCDQSFLLSLFRISVLPENASLSIVSCPLDGCWPSFESLHRENWPHLSRRYFCAFGIQVWSFKTYHSWMFTRHYYYLTRLCVPSDTSCLASNSPILVMAWLVTQLR